MNNPFFWLGEVGLIVTVIAGYCLQHLLHKQPLVTTLPIRFLVILSLAVLAHPVVHGTTEELTNMQYLLRLAWGLVMAGRLWFYLTEKGQITSEAARKTVNRMLRWSSVVGLLLLALIGWRIRNNR